MWRFATVSLAALLFFLPGHPTRAAKPVPISPIDLDEASEVSYEKDIVPILNKHCFECHKPENREGGLDVTSMAAMLRGGKEFGPSILPGRPDQSPLVKLVIGKEGPMMPQDAKPLSPAEVHLLRQWIAAGAKDDSVVFSREEEAFFERQIRPVLHNRCLKCHAGLQPESNLDLTSRIGVLQGGSRGPAVSASDPEDSLLLKAIRHEGDVKMPLQGEKLTDAEIVAFQQWIRKGLPWPRESAVLTRERLFSVTDADLEHWAFQPLEELPPPNQGTQLSIDALLTAKLKEKQLALSPPADKYALLRRLTYDLTGFPPSIEEIEAFTSDASPAAWEKAVDRLLESPFFGRRWGRHWLDYTRIDTQPVQPKTGRVDFDYNRYRKWVERSVNADLPYDRFVQIHLAGDLLPSPEGREYDIDQALAATVPLWGPRTVVDITKDEFVLVDKLDEGVEFLGRSVLGLGLECARCHDHKFDPISQRDYYALFGIFRSSWAREVPAEAKNQSDIRRIEAEEAATKQAIKELSMTLEQARSALKRNPAAKTVKPAEIAARYAEIYQAKNLWYLKTQILWTSHRGKLARERGANAEAADFEQQVSRFEQQLAIAQKDKYQYSSNLDKRRLDGIVQSLASELTDIGEFEAALEELAEIQARQGKVRNLQSGDKLRASYAGYTPDAPEVAHLVKIERELETLKSKPRVSRVFVRAEGGVSDLNDKRSREPFIGDQRLLIRGDIFAPGPVVPRRFPVLFSGDEQIPLGEQTRSGRLELAQELFEQRLSRELIARVMANRVWQHLFGEALCQTPSDLGRSGHLPVHDDLLDYLAGRLIQSDWSVKALVNEIVLSDAYRQSSRSDPLRAERDPKNSLFSHQNIRLIESELIANTFAAIAFGRPHDLDAPLVPESEQDVKTDPYQVPIRRGFTTTTKLNLVEGLERATAIFDAPNPDLIVDVRLRSTVPTQLLKLMNGRIMPPFIDAIEQRVKESSEDPHQQLTNLFLLLYGRPPSTADREQATRLLQLDSDSADSGAMKRLVHLMLCSNEFLYVD